ncbi:MAG: class I SAM-dependent methyltransferase [Chitinophagaceae bacterium]|nr:class I SAM-dependent methyltransferase [Chitinophagaceae bacterium]
MIKNFFKQLRWRRVAGQLRKPAGKEGMEIARKMNAANEFLYDFTLDEMLIRDNQTLLEIGFGNGKFFSRQFDRAANLRITGIDYSPEMIKAARSENEEWIKKGHLTLIRGESDRMPFNEASFDSVFSINVTYFWDYPQDHLLEIHRVLKPGGRFYTTIRTPESLATLPFSSFGFRMYTVDDWKLLCHLNHLTFIRCAQVTEPPVAGKGPAEGLKSVCLVAEKKIL